MPKRKISYECVHCKEPFPDYDSCLYHECDEHFHITVSQYHEWQKLKDNVTSASATVHSTKNPETDAAFDKAIKELMAFEEKHNLIFV